MGEDTITPAGEALRGAMLDALREIQARLAGDAIAPTDVHLARRAAKRARALARLAPSELAALAQDTRRTVGRARRALGEARDADVRAATLNALKPKLGDAHDTLSRLAGGAGDCRTPAPDMRMLREDVAALIRDWSLCEPNGGIDEIVAAAGSAYRRMRRRARAGRGGGTEALHRWRSTVADFEYDADFLSRFSPEMKRARHDADRLRKHLGEINDLDELYEHVARNGGDGPERQAVHRLAQASAARRARLVSRALARADALLALKPAQWTKRLRRSCAQ